MRIWVAFLAALGALLAGLSPLAAEPGKLVIVGGGLEPDNAEVYRAFLDARPADAPTIVIVPAASGEPAASAEAARAAMIAYGAKPGEIEIARIAMRDDPGTKTVDESRWADNVGAEEERARIARAGAIWFTGGDQSRITGLLLERDGADTPLLAAIRARLDAGAVVGGTSAGAAIMSGAMITGGDSMGALVSSELGEELGLARGLHFLRGALVDQHFGERARLGRLAVALARLQKISPLGLGIDEDTALVVAPGRERAEVVGTGYVTVLDARSAKAVDGARLAIGGLVVGLAGHGDTIDLGSGEVRPAWYRKPTIGHEYEDRAVPPAGGMAVTGSNLADVLGNALLDNAASREVVRHSFAENRGVTYRFIQSDESRGWWGRDPAGRARYAISGVRFAIEPISVTIEQVEN